MKLTENKGRLNMEEIEVSLIYDHGYMPEHVNEIMPKLEEIDRLREEKNGILLAHYYQIPPIQLLADIKGDSLRLAEAAKEIKDKRLVVCSTVVFMAEMVKLLSPDKKVIVPDLESGCSIAAGINGESVHKIREKYPTSAIVSYINTYADTKAEVDAVFTSANAKTVVRNITGDPVIMIPDYYISLNTINKIIKEENDGRTYLAYKGKDNGDLVLENVVNREEVRIRGIGFKLPVLDKGTCIVHEQFTPQEINYLRKKDNIEEVIAHPEVNPEVAKVADFVGGTGKMIDYVRNSPAKKFLVITECDLTAPLREAFPKEKYGKEFYTPCILCPYMKKNSIDTLLHSFRNEVHEIHLGEKTAQGARRSLERMFELTGGRK